jgi:hypothetical protein
VSKRRTRRLFRPAPSLFFPRSFLISVASKAVVAMDRTRIPVCHWANLLERSPLWSAFGAGYTVSKAARCLCFDPRLHTRLMWAALTSPVTSSRLILLFLFALSCLVSATAASAIIQDSWVDNVDEKIEHPSRKKCDPALKTLIV